MLARCSACGAAAAVVAAAAAAAAEAAALHSASSASSLSLAAVAAASSRLCLHARTFSRSPSSSPSSSSSTSSFPSRTSAPVSREREAPRTNQRTRLAHRSLCRRNGSSPVAAAAQQAKREEQRLLSSHAWQPLHRGGVVGMRRARREGVEAHTVEGRERGMRSAVIVRSSSNGGSSGGEFGAPAGRQEDGRRGWGGREVLVQHLVVREDQAQLLAAIQKRIINDGEDLSDLARQYSICPSGANGGMLGWIAEGRTIAEFEAAAFGAKVNQLVRAKTKHGLHLLQVLAERQATILEQISVEDFHARLEQWREEEEEKAAVRSLSGEAAREQEEEEEELQPAKATQSAEDDDAVWGPDENDDDDLPAGQQAEASGRPASPDAAGKQGSSSSGRVGPALAGPGATLSDQQQKQQWRRFRGRNAPSIQLIDVREPSEKAMAFIPGFELFPLSRFGDWGPRAADILDPQKDTFVLCHHGVRSQQAAEWLKSQGFRHVYNIVGGIHAYSLKVDPSIPLY